MENNNPNPDEQDQQNRQNQFNQQQNQQFSQNQYYQNQYGQGQYNQGQYYQNQFNQQFGGQYEISNEDKAAAVICYFGLLGFIIALVLHSQKKTRIGAFHMRQALGLMISGFVFGFCSIILVFIPILGWLALLLIAVGLFVLFIMGIVNAAQGKFAPLPVLGPMFMRMFGNTFD